MEFEPLDQFHQRQKKLAELESLGHPAYPRKFAWSHTARQVVDQFGNRDAEKLDSAPVDVRVAGRILALRPQGKAGFAQISGDGAKLQIYVRLDVVGEEVFKIFKLLDLGDIIGVSGHLFRTKTDELTIKVSKIELLTKALLPLPEKWHGLADTDQRYRRRYLDLIVNHDARDIFLKRAAIIREFRRFFDERGYIEVETPMMHPILGGATARPFITHHNAFDTDLYLRIAPELYLKRLIVGGLDRVYEMNRNFRNEGIDAIHQPEFTMLEFYQAYSDVNDLMDLTEELLRGLTIKVTGNSTVKFGELEIDFSQIGRLSMRAAIAKFWPADAGPAPCNNDLGDDSAARAVAQRYNDWAAARAADIVRTPNALSGGEITGELFELVAERHLQQPTFIYDFPTAISPLAKCRPDDPTLTERFELFIAGMEIANGFSELNDPADQERRFQAQVAKGGTEVAKEVDVDYIRALSHGLPPTAGEGIGVDRLVMLLTNSQAIREVILFPLLRPRAATEEAEPENAAGAEAGGSAK